MEPVHTQNDFTIILEKLQAYSTEVWEPDDLQSDLTIQPEEIRTLREFVEDSTEPVQSYFTLS
jgi:hypothetical protein